MWRFAALAAAAAAVALSIPAITHLLEEPPPLPSAARLFLAPPNGTELGAGDELLDAAISPSQREIVFVATWLQPSGGDGAPPGSTQLWRRRFDAQAAEPLAGTVGASLPAWKQTGNVVSFFSGTRLKLLNLRTGVVSDAVEATAPAGATWLRDGSLLFVPAAGPVRRLLSGQLADATRLASGDAAHAFPVASANGQDFTYVAVRGDGRRVIRLHSGGKETDLGTTSAHAELPDRWLLFVRDATLLADHRDTDGRMGGQGFPLALDVGATQSGRGMFVASADVLLHAPPADRPRQITWLDMDGKRLGTVADVGDYWQIRVSPDEANLAVTARDRLLGSLDVLKIPVQDGTPSLRLTTSVGPDSDPVWSPDGERLAFRSTQRGRPEVFVTPATITPVADGANRTIPLNTTGDVITDWRSSEMLVQRREKTIDLVRVHETTGSVTPIADSPFNETDGRWSPDGRLIAYVSDEPGRPDIYVQTDNGEQQRVSLGGGTHPRWTRDSRALLFLRGSTIMKAELVGGTRFGPPRPVVDLPGIRDFAIARRAGRIVALLPVQGERREVASVILNWRSLAETQRRLLEKKTPRKF